MSASTENHTVRINGPRDLRAPQAIAFLAEASAALARKPRIIEVDLSATIGLDGGGLGALLKLHRQACRGGGIVLRLLRPLPGIRHLLELARLHRIFEITSSDQTPAST